MSFHQNGFKQHFVRVKHFIFLEARAASQSEAMTVAVGLSPREGSAITGRRGATLEGLDSIFGSGVAPRRAPYPHPYSVGSSPRLPSRSRSATSQELRYALLQVAPLSLDFG